jgi:hypothetical protein
MTAIVDTCFATFGVGCLALILTPMSSPEKVAYAIKGKIPNRALCFALGAVAIYHGTKWMIAHKKK